MLNLAGLSKKVVITLFENYSQKTWNAKFFKNIKNK